MSIVAKSTGGGMDPLEAGTYPARLVKLIHVGTIPEEFNGKPKKMNKVILIFELPTEKVEFDSDKGEEPRLLSKEFTLSLNSKSNLRKALEAWRGQAFTEEELEGFDILNLKGVPCMISTVNKKSEGGKEYTNISSISKMMKGVELEEQITPMLEFHYSLEDKVLAEAFGKLPEWIQSKIVTAAEWIEKGIKIEPKENIPEDEVSEAVKGEEKKKSDVPF